MMSAVPPNLRRAYFKPFASRIPVLVFMLCITIALLALTELACHRIYAHDGAGSYGNIVGIHDTQLFRRQRHELGWKVLHEADPSITDADALLHARSVTTTKTSQALSTGTSTDPHTLGPSEIATLFGGPTISLNPITSRDSGPDPASTRGPPVVDPTPIVQPTPAAQPTPTQIVSTMVRIQTEQNTAILVGTIMTTPFLPETSQVESTFVSWDSNGNPTTLVTNVATTNYIAHPTQLLSTDISLQRSLNTILSVATVKATQSIETFLTTSFLTSACVGATSEICTSTIVGTGTRTDWIPISGATDLALLSSSTSKTILPRSSTIVVMEPTATVVNTSGTFFIMPDGSIAIPHQILLSEYLLVAWVPLLIAALFTIPWRIVDSTVREMEPFYQLKRLGGVTADDSLFLDYATSNFITVPFKALHKRHYVVFASSMLRFSVTVLAPLASETFFVSLSGACGYGATGNCYATWGIYTLLARVIEGMLGLIALFTVLLIILSSRRDSGVFTNPLSIVGLGTLIGQPEFLHKFRAIDSMASISTMKMKLKSLRFRLMMHSEVGEQSYGIGVVEERKEKDYDTSSDWNSSHTDIIPDGPETPNQGGERYLGVGNSFTNLIDRRNLHELEGEPVTPLHEAEEATTTIRTFGRVALRRSSISTIESLAVERRDWRGIADRVLFISAFVSLTGLIIMIIYYRLNTTANVFKRFLDSESFGLRLSLTTVGVLVNLFFSHVDEDFRRFEPYHRLLASSSLADDSILVPIWVTPYTAIVPAIRRKHFLVASIATVAIFSEFLPILLANIPASSAVTLLSRMICTWLSVAILASMLVCAFCLMLRKSSSLHQLPRRPDCLGAVIQYLASGKKGRGLVDALAGLAFVSQLKRDSTVRRMGKKYRLGWGEQGNLCIEDDRFIQRRWR